jgi:3-(3-hydroxy-phenyl)propionate hydroxylase
VRLRSEATGIAQDADGAKLAVVEPAVVRHPPSAHDVVGCDGARSPVGQHMDSAMRELGLRHRVLGALRVIKASGHQ